METERRFYLANQVEVRTRTDGDSTWHELDLDDAWVWDMYRQHRFVSKVHVVTFRDFNIEVLPHEDIETPPGQMEADPPAPPDPPDPSPPSG